jgi:hypothetical protein
MVTYTLDVGIGISQSVQCLGYCLDDQDSVPGRGRDFFLFATTSRSALGTTQPPIQWVTRFLSPGVKRPVREADHSPPTTAEAESIYTSNSPYVFTAWYPVKHRDKCIFIFLPQTLRVHFIQNCSKGNNNKMESRSYEGTALTSSRQAPVLFWHFVKINSNETMKCFYYYDSLYTRIFPLSSSLLYKAMALRGDRFMHQKVAKQRNNDVHRLLHVQRSVTVAYESETRKVGAERVMYVCMYVCVCVCVCMHACMHVWREFSIRILWVFRSGNYSSHLLWQRKWLLNVRFTISRSIFGEFF